MIQRVNQYNLQQFLVNYFDESEQRALCLDLNVNYDTLPGSGTAAKATALVEYCRRRQMLLRLAEAVSAARPEIAAEQLWQVLSDDASPFKGLLVFEEADADIFYGRDDLTDELVQRLVKPGQTPFMALVGASGCGKSSVARAGILPKIRARMPWQIHLITPTAHPLRALSASLTRGSESVTATSTLMDDMAADPRSLLLYTQRLLNADTKRILLVVDQFEELFTLCHDEAERQAFVDNLVYAVDPETAGALVVVITLRADFYGRCVQYPSLHPLLETQQKIIPAMSPDNLRQAIEYPAQYAGLEYESGLVDLILREVGQEPGNLPLLSHVLLETWKRREGERMTLAGYTDAGGVQGAIAKTAESTYNSLTAEQREIARNIFLRLTELGEGTQDTRRRASLTDLVLRTQEAENVETVVRLLADARLVTTEKDTAEVSHEALIREWGRLQGWLEENREAIRLHRMLSEASAAWERNDRDDSFLYRGVRLEQIAAWQEQPLIALNKREHEFLAESLAQKQRDIRLRRLFRVGAFAALVIISLIVTAVAITFQQQAAENKRLADAQSTLVAQAQDQSAARATLVFEAQEQAAENERLAENNELIAETAVAGQELAEIFAVTAEAQVATAEAASTAAIATAEAQINAQATAVAIPEAWYFYENADANIIIQLPPGWKIFDLVDNSNREQILAQLAPEIAVPVSDQLERLSTTFIGQLVHAVGFDLSADGQLLHQEQGVFTFFVIFEEPIMSGVTEELYVEVFRTQMSEFFGFELSDTIKEETERGTVWTFEFTQSIPVLGSGFVDMRQRNHVITNEERALLIYFLTADDFFAEHEDTFDQIIYSVRPFESQP